MPKSSVPVMICSVMVFSLFSESIVLNINLIATIGFSLICAAMLSRHLDQDALWCCWSRSSQCNGFILCIPPFEAGLSPQATSTKTIIRASAKEIIFSFCLPHFRFMNNSVSMPELTLDHHCNSLDIHIQFL